MLAGVTRQSAFALKLLIVIEPLYGAAWKGQCLSRLHVDRLAVDGPGHLLGQLEKLGYLQRRHALPNGHAAVYLSECGWLVVGSNLATMRQIEADWQQQLGKKRFADLKAAQKELTGFD